ncbi:hypothetical protein MTO96_051246, partial [Rhipicephalus appendiculatus]
AAGQRSQGNDTNTYRSTGARPKIPAVTAATAPAKSPTIHSPGARSDAIKLTLGDLSETDRNAERHPKATTQLPATPASRHRNNRSSEASPGPQPLVQGPTSEYRCTRDNTTELNATARLQTTPSVQGPRIDDCTPSTQGPGTKAFIMKHIFAALCVLGLVAFTAHAHVLPERKSSIDVLFENAAQEAIYLSEILNNVGKVLAEVEDWKAESDEYFLLDLWQKTTEAIKNATKEVTVSVTGALEVTKDQLTKAAKDAQDKLKVKAAEIMAKILAKITSQYALEDSSTHTEVMKTIRDLIQAAVNGLLKAGKGFRQLEN